MGDKNTMGRKMTIEEGDYEEATIIPGSSLTSKECQPTFRVIHVCDPVNVVGGWQQSAAIAVTTGWKGTKGNSGVVALGPLGKPVLVGIGVKEALLRFRC
jgi:hypothetical protein